MLPLATILAVEPKVLKFPRIWSHTKIISKFYSLSELCKKLKYIPSKKHLKN